MVQKKYILKHLKWERDNLRDIIIQNMAQNIVSSNSILKKHKARESTRSTQISNFMRWTQISIYDIVGPGWKTLETEKILDRP